MRIKYTLAILAALTLAGAPTAAHAAEEVASSPDTQAVTDTSTSPSTSAAPSDASLLTTSQPATATPPQMSPVTESPATAPEASSTSASKSEPSSSTPASGSSAKPSSSPEAPSPSVEPASLPYVLALWQNPAGAPKFPQQLISASGTASTDVKTALAAVATECGTFYQSDLYANDARTAALVKKGVLNGGDESWPKGEPQRYHTITTDPCVSAPLIQTFPSCKGLALVLDNTGSNVDVTYIVNGLPTLVKRGTAVHTDADGFLYQPTEVGYTITAGDRTWTIPSAGNCPTDAPDEPTEPEHEPTTSQPVPTPPSTTPTEQPTTLTPVETSSTSTQLVAAGNEPTAVQDEPKSEPTDSTDALAYTGSDAASGWWFGGSLLALGAILCASRIVKLGRLDKSRRP